MIVYCLMLEDANSDKSVRDYDVYGLYSEKEKAEEAKQWLKREDGRYDGVPGHTYGCAFIISRIIDCNLPKHSKGSETEIKECLYLEMLEQLKQTFNG